MPFTPFHFGPGLLLKGMMPKSFNLSTFLLVNLALDVEPLYRAWRIETPQHGFSHTLPGAVLIALGIVLISKPLLGALWRILTAWAATAETGPPPGWRSIAGSALSAVFLHLALDAITYPDVHPLSPMFPLNPWYMHDPGIELGIYLACTLAAMSGLLLLLIRAAFFNHTPD